MKFFFIGFALTIASACVIFESRFLRRSHIALFDISVSPILCLSKQPASMKGLRMLLIQKISETISKCLFYTFFFLWQNQ